MEAIIKIDDKKTFQTLLQFLKSINIEVVAKRSVVIKGQVKSKNDIDKIALFSAGRIFKDLGTDEDYKEWINAPEI